MKFPHAARRADSPWRRRLPALLLAPLLFSPLIPASTADAAPAAPAAPLPLTARAAADPDNLSPAGRTLAPVAIHGTTGAVTGAANVLTGGNTRLSGAHSAVVLDFGKDVGGLVTLRFGGASGPGQQIGLAFSELSTFIGEKSDLSQSSGGEDGALSVQVDGAGTYTMPKDKLRGGFRYLTVFLSSGGWVDLSGVSLEFTAAPGVATPNAYPNYFHSNDERLNRIWYAGAYTVQLDTIDPNEGRAWPDPRTGWENNGKVGVGTTVLTDGAKRDRTVWPGDLGVSLPTEYASTNDLLSARNSLDTLYAAQKPTGELPYAGPAISAYGSNTYHLWTLVGTATYYLYSGDKTWLNSVWQHYRAGMSYILANLDGGGMLDVKTGPDWGRDGMGGENIEGNALMYQALTGGAGLAQALGDQSDATAWQQKANTLKSAVNAKLWNPTLGLYRDNPTSTIYPQDGNSLAVSSGLTDSPAKDAAIMRGLKARWNQLGAVTPEKPGLIGTFPGSLEVLAHFGAGDDVGGLDLIRREWGHMLDAPEGTNTFWESYNFDGTPYYNSSYTSAAHGWATGPTAALTFSVLGLHPTGAAGQFDFVPHPGDLTHVEGDITLPQGQAGGNWDYAPGTFTEHLTSPAGSTARIGVPTYGSGAVTVKVNGTTVWSNGSFRGAPGIGGASSDGGYVYLTGVAPGSYTVTADHVVAPQAFDTSVLPSQLPPGYVRCADEGGTCTPNGTQVLAYGAETFHYQRIGAPTACTNDALGGDPDANVRKSCYLAPAGGPAGYTSCATEGGTCSVDGVHEVAYGGNGAYRFQLVKGAVACTTAAFGSDPLPDVVKNCYVAAQAPPGNWTSCAAEGAQCAATGDQPLAFGTGGAYTTGPAAGPASCTAGTFGTDPAYGIAKTCYTWDGPPPGFTAACSAEKEQCSFSGTRTVAFGSDGKYVYRTFTGGTPCTTEAFGSDPLTDVAKTCYLAA